MKKIISMLMCLFMLPLTACTAGPAVTAPAATDAPTEQPTAEPTARVINTDVTYSYSREQQYTPFWLSDVMYNECCCFVQNEDGTITAKLAFKPLKIVSVRNWALDKELTEGVDYLYDEQNNCFTLPAGSTVPYFTQNFLHGKNEDGSAIPAFNGYDKEPWSTLGMSGWGNAIYCIGPQLYEKQVFVTYVYDRDTFTGPAAQYQGDKLPKTMAKLKSGEKFVLEYYGDSIPVGCDSSRMYNRKPFQDGFPVIVRKALETVYDTRVTYYNKAVGGTTSEWCVQNIEADVIKNSPDLVVLMTGGNDGDGNIAFTKKNVIAFIKKLRESLPDCEVLLMDVFEGNKDGNMDFPNLRPVMKETFDEVAAMFEGVISVGIYDLHKYMLTNKNYIDFSGNGINHPNDYMIRLYAQQLVATLVDYGA